MKRNTLPFAALLLIAVPALGAEEVLKFHLECKETSKKCMQMTLPDKPEEKFMVLRRPSMTVGPADVASVKKAVDTQENRELLMLHLSKSAGEKFAKLTKANVQKRLAIVVGKDVLTAPVIMTEISGGNLQLTPALGKGFEYLDQVPWLKKMAEATP